MTSVEKKGLVAKTILNQLGGSKFIAMTGARSFTSEEDALNFRIPSKNKSKATHIKVILNVMDTYDMEFISSARLGCRLLNKIGSIHAEDLQRIFTIETGLDTHL